MCRYNTGNFSNTINVVSLPPVPAHLTEFKLVCKPFPISFSYSKPLPRSIDFHFMVTRFLKVQLFSLLWSLINSKIKAHFMVKP